MAALPFPRPQARGATPDPTPTPASTAITITAALLAARENIDLAQVDDIYAVAVNEIERYAPGAPTANKNMAIQRFGGYLWTIDNNNLVSETIGPLTVTHVVNHASAFRNSGAAMLLTGYRKRRGGLVG